MLRRESEGDPGVLFRPVNGALRARSVVVSGPQRQLARAVLALAALSLARAAVRRQRRRAAARRPRARGLSAAGFASSGRPPRGRLGDGRRIRDALPGAPRRRRAYRVGRRRANDVRALRGHRRGGGQRSLAPRHGDRVRRQRLPGDRAGRGREPRDLHAPRRNRVVRERPRRSRAGLHPRAPAGRRARPAHRHRGALRRPRAATGREGDRLQAPGRRPGGADLRRPHRDRRDRPRASREPRARRPHAPAARRRHRRALPASRSTRSSSRARS